MDTDARLKFLQGELKELIELTSRMRQWNRKQALIYKILSVCFAAAITVLLGLKVDAALADIFRNIALVFGATITVFNAVEAFFDYRSLWVNQTIFRGQLFTLERDVKFYTLHPKQGESHEEMLMAFEQRLNQISEDHVKRWLQMRDAEVPGSASQGSDNKGVSV